MAEPNYLSPQEKLKNYYKEQAKKSGDAVRKGRNKFAKDYIEPTAKIAGSFTPMGPVIGLTDAYNSYKKGDSTGAVIGAGLEVLPYAGKYIGEAVRSNKILKPIVNSISNLPKTSSNIILNKISELNPIIKDYWDGIKIGLADNRSFFEKFPITKSQKKKVVAAQDEAFNSGNKFVEDYFNGNTLYIRDEIKNKISNIDPNILENHNYFNLSKDNLFGNPITNSKNILIGSNRNTLKNSKLSDEAKNYINKKRGLITGANIPDTKESITLRNHGWYYRSPDNIEKVAAHELTHAAQKLGDPFKPYSKEITIYDPIEHEYFYSNPNTEIGKKFGETMVDPVKGEYTWSASPDELHAELLPAKHKMYKQLVEMGVPSDEAMKEVINPQDDNLDWLLYEIGKTRTFFKNTATQEQKRDLLKILPISVPVGIIGNSYINSKKEGGKINWLQQSGNIKLYNKLNPREGFGIGSIIDNSILYTFGQGKPRKGTNLATPEEEAYWKLYNKVPQDIVKPTNVRINADKGDTKSEFVGMPESMKERIAAMADTLNLGKIVRDPESYRTKFPNSPINYLGLKRNYQFAKKVLDNPGKGHQASEEYSMKESPIGNTGLGALENFGLMWDKNKKVLKAYDTYDFPSILDFVIPKRDKPLKIREEIPFDPTIGSKILKNNFKEFNSIK